MHTWKSWLVAGLALCLAACLGVLSAECVQAQTRQGSARTRTLRGIEAVRYLYSRGDYARVEQFAYGLLWEDIQQPEVLYLLADSLFRQAKKEDAAVYLTLLLRVLEKNARRADVTKYKRRTQRQLALLDKEYEKLKAAYARTASGKRFESPEKVDDLWMTQVTSDLHGLHGLYAWKLVGGRKDMKPDWIHNRQGVMHRSGMKYVDQVDGRKGVLFGIPIKDKTSQDADKFHRAILERLGHPTQITIRNLGKCKFLRVGTKGYGFPFILRARRGEKVIFSSRVGTDAWADLKVDLQDAAGKPETITVELVVPEKQRWSEGVWVDYMDFFDN